MSTWVSVVAVGLVVLLAALIAFSMARRKETPRYYLRPSEMDEAAARCAAEGGLQGLGVVVSEEGVTFTAICNSGKSIRWEK